MHVRGEGCERTIVNKAGWRESYAGEDSRAVEDVVQIFCDVAKVNKSMMFEILLAVLGK